MDNSRGANFFEFKKIEDFSNLFNKVHLLQMDELYEQAFDEVTKLLIDGETRLYEIKNEIRLIKKDKVLTKDGKAKLIAKLNDDLKVSKQVGC